MAKVTICIDVADKTSAQAFYTQALGCELVKESDTHVELSADGTTIYLGEHAAGSNPLTLQKAARSYDRHWTPVHLDFIVDDIDVSMAKILELGGVKEGESQGEWGAAAFCADPFGNGFCILKYNE